MSYHKISATPGQASRQLHDAAVSLRPQVRGHEATRPYAPSDGMRPPLPPDSDEARNPDGLRNQTYATPQPRPAFKMTYYQDRESALGAQVVVGAAAPGANPYGTVAGDQGISFSDVLRQATAAPPPGRSQVVSSIDIDGNAILDSTPFIS